MEAKFFLDYSDNINEFIENHQIGINDFFKATNLEYSITYGVVPSNQENNRSKNIVPVILASSTAVFIICTAVSQILSVYYKKPVLVEIIEQEEIFVEGKILKDKDGKPVLKEKKRFEFIEPKSGELKNKLDFSLNVKHGVILRVGECNSQDD